MIVTLNPATGEPLAEYGVMQIRDIETLLEHSRQAQLIWRAFSLERRSRCMKRLADLLRAQKEHHGALISREMGKPIGQAVGEVTKCASVCDYFAEKAAHYLQPEREDIDGAKGLVKFEPLGVILGIMPWNFPYWQVIRFAAAAMMAGNGIVIKHAPNVTGCAIALETLFREAEFPENLYRTVHVAHADVDLMTGLMIDHPVIKAVSVTGSTAAGRAVASKAGRALKRSVLELGGSDPYIVLDDADIDQAVGVCVASRLLNAGQSCIAAKRFIVHTSVYKAFERLIVEKMSSALMGDPFEKSTQVGPIARADLREQLHNQVIRSVKEGAKLLCGGTIPEGRGYFYPPTVLTGVKKGMAAYAEELFGPVAVLIEVSSDDEAVTVANDTPYGLGSAVFSRDMPRARAVADRLEAGNCFINAMVKSDPRLPFGGVKESGYGRELSHYGILEFVNVKSFCIVEG